MYGRLAWDEPAQTVTTGFGSMGQGRYVHPARKRTLTPHEAARLQMLPDFYDFDGVQTRTALATMIGNAVPPVLAMAIGEALLPALRVAAEQTAVPVIGRRVSTAIPVAPSADVRRRMQATRQRGTKPEQAFKLVFDSHGWSYLEDVAPVAGLRSRPDFVFTGPRLAVYIDGCFWHSCPEHGTMPKRNQAWWADKLEANRRRDAEANRRLHEAGWTVVRFWAHDDPERAAGQLASALLTEDSPQTTTAT
jgi:DNA mismatch endonuclease (patch repair protein)